MLANDDYYASSYQRQRYDDLQSASGSVDLVSTDGSGEGSPNCVLLTANWIAGTRYQLDFNMTNPTGGRGSEASDLSFWFAPLTYARIDENHLQHTVRGSKAGQVCVEGTSLQNYGKELFDACEVVSSQLTKQLSGEDVCLSELRNHYQADSFPWSDEYSGRVNVHKSATGLGISAQAVTNSTCGANEAFSSHFGGECIDCGTGEVQYSENTQQPLSCVCPTDRIQNLIGSPACGGPKSVIEEANTTRQVANSLCAFYSQKYDGLLSQQTSALSVIHTYIEDFQDQAHLLLDIDEMSRINKTFVDKYMFDERLEKSPTRKSGIHPNCYKCDTVETQQNGQIVGVSMFKDFNSGALGEVQDVFFQAVHTFRLIGFALHSLGKKSLLACFFLSSFCFFRLSIAFLLPKVNIDLTLFPLLAFFFCS